MGIEMVRRWLRRYWMAEAAGTVITLIAVVAVSQVTSSYVAVALIGSWAENVGYYGVILARELRADLRVSEGHRWRTASSSIRNLALEFGPAEVLDTIVSRPVCMYLGQRFLGEMTAGAMLGKLAADVLFYIPVVVTYEARSRRNRRASAVRSNHADEASVRPREAG